MKVGQTIRIRVNGAKGHIISIDDHSIEIAWEKDNNAIDYGERIKYDLPHIEDLVKTGVILIYDELPKKDPNLLFKRKK